MDRLAPGLREKYPTLDRILKHPGYDGKAVQAEIWDALLEITELRMDICERLQAENKAMEDFMRLRTLDGEWTELDVYRRTRDTEVTNGQAQDHHRA